MSSLPVEIFYNVTNFLPNDDITDLMLMSKKFNALVTPRLQKINKEMATMNQSIIPSQASNSDHKWILQLDLKRFEPIGSKAKKRMMEVLANSKDLQTWLSNIKFERYMNANTSAYTRIGIDSFKERMSLERFDDESVFCILVAFSEIPPRVLWKNKGSYGNP